MSITAHILESSGTENDSWTKLSSGWEITATDDGAGSVTIPLEDVFNSDGNVKLSCSIVPMSAAGIKSQWFVEEIADSDSITLTKQSANGSGSDQAQLRVYLNVPPEFWPTQ